MSTQVILLQKVENLGELGDVVSVKPGFARNYLLPQQKALRATKQNVAYFETQKKAIEADNKTKKADAEKLAKKVSGLKVPLIRAASESGQLYGSVNSRNIADAVSATSGEKISRSHVDINRNFKMVGLFPVHIVLHPEVKVEVTVNIARTEEEAQIQADTGRALVASASDDAPQEDTTTPEAVDADLEGVLEDSALEMEADKAAEAAAKAEADALKAEEKAAKAAEADAPADTAEPVEAKAEDVAE